MPDLSSKSILVVDHGVFVETALRLAREGGFGQVFYCDPTWQEAFSKIDHAVIGAGFQEIKRKKEIWGLIDRGEVDCVMYPDVHNAEEQEHIERLGIPVWGSRTADKLEINKLWFKLLQKELGMNQAEYEVIDGLEKLREFCRDPENNDRWIKLTPQFRGNRETFHHEDYEQSREILDEMGLEFGVLQKILRFIAEKPLEGKLEGGIDTYVIDGQHPNTVISGWEKKDKCYFAEVVDYTDLPDELRNCFEPILPELKLRRCRQMISTEAMIEDEVLLEPTIRFPSPAGEEQMELYDNFSEIIWEGAQGNLIEPKIAAKFACEAMIEHNGDDERWRSFRCPSESVRRWFKFYNICQIGDLLGTAPGSNVIGAVVGIGETPREALEHLKANAEAMKNEPVTIHIEAVAAVLDEIEKAKEEGIAFRGADIPAPAEVLQER